jgi:hypothetical protein
MLPTLPANVKPDTISALTAQIKLVLEETFVSVCVVGEISSLSIAGSGHVYFTLKDKSAILPSVMWKSTALRHRYQMKDGMEVVVRGKISVYPPHGKYQLTADALYQTGVGQQDLALQKLKEKLKKLGYFALDRKRALPQFPRRIALVTSPTGAAVRDMLEIISRRWPSVEVWIIGVRVQGVGAAEEIAAALDRLNQRGSRRLQCGACGARHLCVEGSRGRRGGARDRCQHCRPGCRCPRRHAKRGRGKSDARSARVAETFGRAAGSAAGSLADEISDAATTLEKLAATPRVPVATRTPARRRTPPR